ncbi:unnamed protein product [marine sediment metagenome]|uniref:Uncharacterized protein n=1 Tax=marine sediment metagenome TaxID=412755 RepID=X1Q5R8_9ZZZZ
MVKDVKKVKLVKGDYVAIKVVITKKTRRALRIKCAIMDISVKQAVRDLIEKWVMDVKRDVIDTKEIK